MSKEVDRILEENIYSIKFGTMNELPTTNGVLDKHTLGKEKSKFLGYLAGIWASELVKVKKGYPKGGKVRIEMNADAVMIKRKDFIKLKQAYLNLKK